MAEPDISPPSPWLALAEPVRAAAELGSLVASWPLIGSAPRGDGHPVLVLPGYAGSDASTWFLREYLTRLGYRALPWNLGRNRGGANGTLAPRLARRLNEIHDRTGSRVSIVGWSLGGVFARMLALHVPEEVRTVVTLGSPIGGRPTATTLYRLYSRSGDPRAARIRAAPDPGAGLLPPSIPFTAIYSRSDGVVAWQIAREQPAPLTENIEVVSSHVGLGVNPAVFYAIADRLAQEPEDWRPFHHRGWRRLIYPPIG